MAEPEPFGQGVRLLVLFVLVTVLVGLPVWYGSNTLAVYELVVGRVPEWPTTVLERVVPLTDRSHDREPWEETYMYAVSAVAVVWICWRFCQGWRFDCQQLAFVPRSRHLSVLDLWRARTGSRETSENRRRSEERQDG